MFLSLCFFSHFVLIYHSFTPVFPARALGPVSVSLIQTSMFFPLNPSTFHPSVLARLTYLCSSSCTSAASPFSPRMFCNSHYIALIVRIYNNLQQTCWRSLGRQPHRSPERTVLKQVWPAACPLDFTETVFKCLGKYLFLLLVTVSLGGSLLCQSTRVAPSRGSADALWRLGKMNDQELPRGSGKKRQCLKEGGDGKKKSRKCSTVSKARAQTL